MPRRKRADSELHFQMYVKALAGLYLSIAPCDPPFKAAARLVEVFEFTMNAAQYDPSVTASLAAVVLCSSGASTKWSVGKLDPLRL